MLTEVNRLKIANQAYLRTVEQVVFRGYTAFVARVEGEKRFQSIFSADCKCSLHPYAD